MKKLLLCGVAAFALAACGQENSGQSADGAPERSAATEQAADQGEPELGDWGIELEDIAAAGLEKARQEGASFLRDRASWE